MNLSQSGYFVDAGKPFTSHAAGTARSFSLNERWSERKCGKNAAKIWILNLKISYNRSKSTGVNTKIATSSNLSRNESSLFSWIDWVAFLPYYGNSSGKRKFVIIPIIYCWLFSETFQLFSTTLVELHMPQIAMKYDNFHFKVQWKSVLQTPSLWLRTVLFESTKSSYIFSYISTVDTG